MLVIVSLMCTVVFNSASICWSLVLSCLFWLSSEVTLILFYPKHSLPPDSDYNNNMLLTPRKHIPECLGSNRGQRPGCSNWQRQSVGQVRSGAGRHSGQRRSERGNWGHAQLINLSIFVLHFLEKSNMYEILNPLSTLMKLAGVEQEKVEDKENVCSIWSISTYLKLYQRNSLSIC